MTKFTNQPQHNVCLFVVFFFRLPRLSKPGFGFRPGIKPGWNNSFQGDLLQKTKTPARQRAMLKLLMKNDTWLKNKLDRLDYHR